jgi:hypothetical protein
MMKLFHLHLFQFYNYLETAWVVTIHAILVSGQLLSQKSKALNNKAALTISVPAADPRHKTQKAHITTVSRFTLKIHTILMKNCYRPREGL